MVLQEEQQLQKFGANITCKRCGVPQRPKNFANGTVYCPKCTKILFMQSEAVVTLEDHNRSDFRTQLTELRRTRDPHLVDDVEEARGILGASPLVIAARCTKELLDPAAGRSDLSDEQRAALPKDYRTIQGFVKIMQEAEAFREKQLEGTSPFDDATPDELRATMLDGAIEFTKHNVDLRKQLIRGFVERCPTFLTEVMEVISERRIA